MENVVTDLERFKAVQENFEVTKLTHFLGLIFLRLQNDVNFQNTTANNQENEIRMEEKIRLLRMKANCLRKLIGMIWLIIRLYILFHKKYF